MLSELLITCITGQKLTYRIGITGGSDGGTQSAVIAALDNRIYASAPGKKTWDDIYKFLSGWLKTE